MEKPLKHSLQCLAHSSPPQMCADSLAVQGALTEDPGHIPLPAQCLGKAGSRRIGEQGSRDSGQISLWIHSLHASQTLLGSGNPCFSGLVDKALPSSHSVPYTVLDTMRTKEVLLPVLKEFNNFPKCCVSQSGVPYHLHVNHQGH